MIRIEHLPADVFGLSPLLRGALSGRHARVGVARTLADVKVPADAFHRDERAHLARWLESQVTAKAPPVAVLDSIRALAQPGTSCVVGSAKPALLLGPASSLWRALQVVQLARALTSSWGTRVVPILWNLTDAHDDATLECAHVLNRNFDLQKVALERVSKARLPLHELRLERKTHGLGALRGVLEQLYGDFLHTERALEIFMPREGESLPDAFTRALYELFGTQGLVVIEPQVLGEEQSHALARVVSSKAHIELANAWDALPRNEVQSAEALRAQPLVYGRDARGMRGLFLGGDGFRYEDEPGSRTAAELAAEIVQSPDAWSAGEALRPLVRDQILPVAACVGDERELLGHHWVHTLRAGLELPSPAFLPLARATLIEDEDRRALERLQLSLADALRGRSVTSPASGSADAGTLVRELQEITAQARRALAARKERLLDLDPTLASSLKLASQELEALMGKLCQKVGRVHATIDGRRERHQRRLRNALCPRDHAQDLVLGPFAWVARYGTDWIEELARELDPFAGEHLAVHVSEEARSQP